MIFQNRSRLNFFGEYPEKSSTQHEVKEHTHTHTRLFLNLQLEYNKTAAECFCNVK